MSDEEQQDVDAQAVEFAIEYARFAAEFQHDLPADKKPHVPRNIGQLLTVAGEIREFLYGETYQKCE